MLYMISPGVPTDHKNSTHPGTHPTIFRTPTSRMSFLPTVITERQYVSTSTHHSSRCKTPPLSSPPRIGHVPSLHPHSSSTSPKTLKTSSSQITTMSSTHTSHVHSSPSSSLCTSSLNEPRTSTGLMYGCRRKRSLTQSLLSMDSYSSYASS